MRKKARVRGRSSRSTRGKSGSRGRKHDIINAMDSSIDQAMLLQKTIGNRAVQQLVESGSIQTKLKISRPGDKYEQEAKRLADRVMRMPTPFGQQEHLQTVEKKEGVVQQTQGVNKRLVQRQEEETEKKTAKPSYDMGSPVSNATESFYTINESDFAKIPQHFKFVSGSQRYAGKTKWNVGYSRWQATKKGNEWFVDPIPWIINSIKVVLPKWSNFSKARDSEKKEWARFIKCTRQHEQGHIDRVRKFMNQDMPNEWKLVSDPQANKLAHKIKKLHERVLVKLQEISDTYDVDTNHGATQNAVLKSP